MLCAYSFLIYILITIHNIPPSNSSSSSSTSTTPKSDVQSVITLTSRNFDSRLRDGNAWLVEFYAPWCGHCKTFAPTYKKIAHTLHKDHNDDEKQRKVFVAKVDSQSERALAFRFNVKGFPSFYLIEGWAVRKYSGTRSLESLVKFANETYDEVEPMPFLTSPFGPIGQLRGLLISGGAMMLESHEKIVEKTGLSSIQAAVLLAMVFTFCALTVIICIGLISVNKMKTD